MRTSLGAAVLAVRRSRRIALLQFLGNPLLFLLFIVWLWVPERHSAQLVLTVLLGFIIVAGGLILHALTLAYFRECPAAPAAPHRTALRGCLCHLPSFLVWLVIVVFLFRILDEAGDRSLLAAAYFRSLLPMPLRASFPQAAVDHTAVRLLWIAKYYLLPVLLLPLGMQLAYLGIGGASVRNSLRPLGRAGYWLIMAALSLLGVWLPAHLIFWNPVKGPLSIQVISLVTRLLAAYLAALLAWLLALALTGDILCAFDPASPLPALPVEDAGDDRDRDAPV